MSMLKLWILEIILCILNKDIDFFDNLFCAMNSVERSELFLFLDNNIGKDHSLYEWFHDLKRSKGFPNNNLFDCTHILQENVHIWIWSLVDWAYHNDLELLKRMYYLMDLDESISFISFMDDAFDVKWDTVIRDSRHIQFLKAHKELTDCVFAHYNEKPIPSRVMWHVAFDAKWDTLIKDQRYIQFLKDHKELTDCVFAHYNEKPIPSRVMWPVASQGPRDQVLINLSKQYSRESQFFIEDIGSRESQFFIEDIGSLPSCPFTEEELFKDLLVVGDTYTYEFIKDYINSEVDSGTG